MRYMLVIETDLWRRFKAACATKGISMKAFILRAIQKLVDEKGA